MKITDVTVEMLDDFLSTADRDIPYPTPGVISAEYAALGDHLAKLFEGSAAFRLAIRANTAMHLQYLASAGIVPTPDTYHELETNVISIFADGFQKGLGLMEAIE